MVIGHQKQWELLRKSAETGKISHAYLFAGQDQLGKRTMALEWISLLFGQDIQKGQHPDFILIEPEGEESKLSSSPLVKTEGEESKLSSSPLVKTRRKKEIRIGQIRDLIWKLSLKPYSAPFKIALIDRAHTMNQEAQTCLLKTLEEPKDKTILILITAFPEYLSPTILSRVQTLKFYSVSKKEIKELVTRAIAKGEEEDLSSSTKKQGIPEGKIESIVELSLGRPGKALDFISDPKKLESFYQKIKELNKISDSTIAFRFQYAKNLSDDSQNLKTTLDIWLSYFRNILLSCLCSSSYGGQVKIKDSSSYSITKLKNILKLIQTTIFLISTTNVNSRLALERLMLEF